MTATIWQSASIPPGQIVSAYSCLHEAEAQLCDRWTLGRWEQFGPSNSIAHNFNLRNVKRFSQAKGVNPNLIIQRGLLQWVQAKINHLKKI